MPHVATCTPLRLFDPRPAGASNVIPITRAAGRR